MLTLVMLPGMDGTGDLFAPFIERLGDDIRTIVVRYPDQDLGYEALIAHARPSLPEHGGFYLLGESFSGPIAVALAAENQERLRGLILSASFVRNPMPWTGPLAPLASVLPVTGSPAALMTRAVLGSFSTPALRDMIEASLAQMSAATIRARLRAIATADVRDCLACVTAPILYLQAARDRVVLPGCARLVADIQPATKVVELDAPHFLLQVAVDDAVREIRAFMAAGQALQHRAP